MVEKQLDRIIETALTLFEKYGYHGVTVDRIVAECGASKGGFYHNFKSKDELLYHIHDVFITVHAKVWKKLYSTQEPRGFSHREVQPV